MKTPSYIRCFFIVIPCVVLLSSCTKTDLKKPLEYTGPMREAENVEMFYTENNLVKVKMTAPVVHEFQNGDQEFPKGINLEFYDETGKLESKLRANHAYFFKDQDQWRGQGNVQVDNIATDEHLTTEELFWKRSTKKIFTDKFVTIRQTGDVVYGDGLDAEQDLSSYDIINPRGQTAIEE